MKTILRRLPSRSRSMPIATAILMVLVPAALSAQSPADPWFGLQLPPGLGNPHRSPVALPADFAVEPAVVPPGEEINTALDSDGIWEDLRTIVGFSRASRDAGDRMWGRVTGRPAALRTVEWVAEQFRELGLQDVEVQPFPAGADMWWPVEWEVRVLADPEFGRGSADIVLESALPTSGSVLQGTITAPLVYVGSVTDSMPAAVDVRGKVAVQLLQPEGGAYSERGRTVAAARALADRGAVAVLNAIEQPGNMHVRDFSNCGGTCFNLGGADGEFVRRLIEESMLRTGEAPRVTISLRSETLSDLTGHNAVGVIPGTVDEVAIVNAHVDGWFDAAGDNADGLAVLLALARFFSDPENEPTRTLVFVASAGHHSSGMNGPSNFVRMNPELAGRAEIAINLEHVAQLELDPTDWRFRPAEQPMSFGISNQSPYLIDVARRGLERYGFRLNPTFPDNVPGDLGGYGSLGIPRVQAIHAGPLYHTSGDVLETISAPGLERAARYFAYFIREVARAPREWIDP